MGWIILIKTFAKYPARPVDNFPIIVERSFSAVAHKGITEKTNEIRSENDEAKHKLKNLQRIITRNRQENS